MYNYTGCLNKKYPLLAGNRNETIRLFYSPSGQLNLSIFNLDSHTLHSKIVHQTPEIQACIVKICSAPETRGLAAWLGACSADSAWADVVRAVHGSGLGLLVGEQYVSSCA